MGVKARYVPPLDDCRVSDLLSSHEHLKSDFANLGKGQEASLTPALLKEVHEIRSWVTENLGSKSNISTTSTHRSTGCQSSRR